MLQDMAACNLRLPASPVASTSGQSQLAGSFQCRPCSGAQALSHKGHLGNRLLFESTAPAAPVPKSFTVRAAKRVSTGRCLVLSTTLAAEEGKEEEVSKLCRGILEWAKEKQKDKKTGIQLFECNADPFDKNVVHFWERYDSFTHMNDIRASPEHTKFMTDVRPLLTGPVGLACYEYKDGQIGNMLNPIGPKGEGGLDDATGQGGGGGGAGYKQQSMTINQGVGESSDREEWGLASMLAKAASRLDKDTEEVEKEEKKEKDGGWLKKLFGGLKG